MKKAQSLVKLIFTCGLCFILIGLIILRQDDIITVLNNKVFSGSKKVSIEEYNQYYRNYDFEFVQNVDDFYPSSYQDLLNIYYTFLNSGQVSFSFYCPDKYENCLSDVQRIANNEDILSAINNYVHPYNSFSHIETEYDSLGKVVISIVKNYNADQIQMIEQKIDELYPQLVSSDSVEDNIRSVHNYIINHVRYDSVRGENKTSNYHSDIAYGPLFEGYAICGGYTDLMELFLERMKIKSYKVSSDEHVWNAVNIWNGWYHLDLTWDDPVASDGKDYLENTYFLVNTNNLLKLEKTQHAFTFDLYPELKEAN